MQAPCQGIDPNHKYKIMKYKYEKSMKHFMLLAFTVILSSVACQLHMDTSALSDAITQNDSIIISGSINYKNLQIIPIIGIEISDDQEFKILSEVIKDENVVVKETGNVNQLSISNNTDDYIFIAAGDIVKGGRQDRTIGNDIIIPPHTRDVPLESFCVESGRWQKRGGESDRQFSDNTKMLSSKDLKLASRYGKDQSEVWQKVSEKQDKLNENLRKFKGEDVEVRAENSATSLQLTLESEELADVISEYRDNLDKLPESSIGFAYAINGELYGIDFYRSNQLFKKLQPKLLDAVIAEAISEFQKDSLFIAVDSKLVDEIIQEISLADTKESEVNEYTRERMYENDEGVMFETRDETQKQKWVRKNYITKGDYSKATDKNTPQLIHSR